jgi:hypothetical protein
MAASLQLVGATQHDTDAQQLLLLLLVLLLLRF